LGPKISSTNLAKTPEKIYLWGFSYVNISMENTNTQTQLTINDIAMTRDVIDLACKRGAFSGAEARQVGTLFEKLDQFIKAAVEQAEAEVPESDTAPETQGE
jgi:hypothetical protein